MFNEVRELVPTLVHYMRIDAGEEQRTEIIRILHIFTRMCIYDDAKLEPHGQNQRILYNFGEPATTVAKQFQSRNTFQFLLCYTYVYIGFT